MELYACGLNYHNQLSNAAAQNITKFSKIAEGKQLKIIHASWFATVLEVDGQLRYHGHHRSGPSDYIIHHADDIESVVGSIEGVQGALTVDGYPLDLVQSDQDSNALIFQRARPMWWEGNDLLTKHVAIAGDGQVAIVARPSSCHLPHSWKPPPRTPTDSLYMFSSMVELAASGNLEHVMPVATLPPIKSLGSTATSFFALVNDGTVLGWGSALHPRVLGRHPTKDSPAGLPYPIPFLEGIPIRKVTAGNWICAAVSRDDDLYIWGGQPGGAISGGRIDCLPQWNMGEDIKLVDIDGGVDIRDVAIGEGHIVALTNAGEVWTTGEGYEGQLGFGMAFKGFKESWTRICGWADQQVLTVGAGGWSSFVLVRKECS